jgi:uncharacterized protein
MMATAVLTLHLRFPGCASLKEKRSIIKPILSRLHREFNVASAELDLQDHWTEAVLGFSTISSDAIQCERLLQGVLEFTARTYRDVEILAEHIEFL